MIENTPYFPQILWMTVQLVYLKRIRLFLQSLHYVHFIESAAILSVHFNKHVSFYRWIPVRMFAQCFPTIFGLDFTLCFFGVFPIIYRLWSIRNNESCLLNHVCLSRANSCLEIGFLLFFKIYHLFLKTKWCLMQFIVHLVAWTFPKITLMKMNSCRLLSS